MGECELLLPPRHPGQVRVVESCKRFNVPCIGRRWGKSTLLLDLLLDDEEYGALYGHPVSWMAATSKIFDEVWRLMLATLPPEIVKRTDVQKHRIELHTGGIIDFWTLDGGDRRGPGRGRKYRRVVIDEAALVPDLLALWSKAIRPTLIDLRGDAWFPSTPRGFNDYHELWQRGNPESPTYDPDWASWRASTFDNPHLPRQEYEDIKKEYIGRPLDYRQEVLAEFVEDQGLIFDLKWLNEMQPPKGWKPLVYQAWDLAGTKQDLEDSGCESVGVALVKDWMERWWLIDMVRGKWDSGALVEQILSFGWKHKAQRIWLEDPVALWLMPFLQDRQRQSGKHLPIQRVTVAGRGDKIARAQAAVVPVMSNGSFYLDPKAPWYKGFRGDLSSFPRAGKDTVDALSLGLAEAMSAAATTLAPAVATTPTTGIRWSDLEDRMPARRSPSVWT